MKAAIGIDVGGTAVKAGVVDVNGGVRQKTSLATEADRGVEHVLSRLADLARRLRAAAAAEGLDVCGVGLGMPGTLSRRRGVVIAPPNLPGWRDVPVVEWLSARIGMRVLLDNDANNAALGEYLLGAGRGVSDMVMLTLGTGIGGGIIHHGRLFHGARENAGELGHTIVQHGGRRCACGQLGCLEAYASASSTAARAAERLAAGSPSILRRVLESAGTLTANDVLHAAQQGDPLAAEVWQGTCEYLAIGCINAQCVLDPERIVLAGGMSAAGEALRQPVAEAVVRLASGMLGTPPEVRLAELGNDAGFIGSALSILQDDAG